MAQTLQWLDPDRRRRRLRLLAEFAGAKVERGHVKPHRATVNQIRDLIASRRAGVERERATPWDFGRAGVERQAGTRAGR